MDRRQLAAGKKVEVIAPSSAVQTWDWPMQGQDGVVKVANDRDHFEVGLEMRFFTPKEIDVKVINRDLVIFCRHDEKQDQYGSVSRELNRIYKLPPDVDTSTVKSQLRPDGVLQISASKAKLA